jgi:hypothetical protein
MLSLILSWCLTKKQPFTGPLKVLLCEFHPRAVSPEKAGRQGRGIFEERPVPSSYEVGKKQFNATFRALNLAHTAIPAVIRITLVWKTLFI